jgi:hypothetical protein
MAARRFLNIMMFVNTPVTVLACSYWTSSPSFDEDSITVPNASLRIVFRNTWACATNDRRRRHVLAARHDLSRP